MACERPLRIVNPRYKGLEGVALSSACFERFGLIREKPPDYEITVPCGRCASCQKKRLQDFRLRLVYELQKYPNSLFITLSFCDYALEEYKGNYNRAISQFLDAMRKCYGKQLRHFFVMEHGTLKGRPHYHGVLLGVPHLDFFKVESIWNRGNKKLRNSSIPFEGFYSKPRGIIYLEYIRDFDKLPSYICKYLTKEYNPDRPTPRVMLSRGFGDGYLTAANVKKHRKDLDATITVNGYPFVLPMYYKNKIFTEDDKIQMTLKSFHNPPPARFVDGREYYTYADYLKALDVFHRKQQMLGLSPADDLQRAVVRKHKDPSKFLKELSVDDVVLSFDRDFYINNQTPF